MRRAAVAGDVRTITRTAGGAELVLSLAISASNSPAGAITGGELALNLVRDTNNVMVVEEG